jgi:hypothetical protein
MSKALIALPLIFMLFACGSKPSKKADAGSKTGAKSPSAQVDPDSKIGLVDQFGVTVSVDVPKAESCTRKYVSVKLDTFNECLPEGLTYVQVANALGYKGELQSKSGDVELWLWNGGSGKYLSGQFVNGKLTGKSQVGLVNG